MKTVEKYQRHHSGVFIVQWEHVSHIVLIAVIFNVCWVHIENTIKIRSGISCMCYVVVILVLKKFINK